MLSCKHCCHAKTKSITYSECVFVALSIEHEMHVRHIAICSLLGKSKGKATPLQAWTGSEGSRKLRFSDFKTIGTRR
jgi:hypothetical protein